MGWTLVDIGDDPQDVENSTGTRYYRRAVITWSPPKAWVKGERFFSVPAQWAAYGVYAFLRDHKNQTTPNEIAYIGKALKFKSRLTDTHHMYNGLVLKSGVTKVCCGRIRFEGVHARPGYYEEIEDILKWVLWSRIHNSQGLESLPGFRGANGRPFKPWVLTNEGYRFNRQVPKRIAYPSIAVCARS
jgi:hypothetical protein